MKTRRFSMPHDGFLRRSAMRVVGSASAGGAGLWWSRGGDSLTPPTAVEKDAAGRLRLGPAERLACQTVVKGTCRVTTTYW
ncbi:MAG TPA: hypothetical protein VMT00_10300 [Thermoanaerobaculia bacterium]|nr:hypothetical protein [Thermoanaerobaculia bacterium]